MAFGLLVAQNKWFKDMIIGILLYFWHLIGWNGYKIIANKIIISCSPTWHTLFPTRGCWEHQMQHFSQDGSMLNHCLIVINWGEERRKGDIYLRKNKTDDCFKSLRCLWNVIYENIKLWSLLSWTTNYCVNLYAVVKPWWRFTVWVWLENTSGSAAVDVITTFKLA